MRRAPVPLFCFCAAIASPARASSEEPPRVKLAYVRGVGAEHCPDASAIRASVTSRLGYDPFQAEAPRALTATIRRDGRRLRAVIELKSGGDVVGTRELSSTQNDCAELAWSMSLAMAIAIDPQRQLDAPPPAPAESKAAPDPVETSGTAAPPVSTALPAAPGGAPGPPPASAPGALALTNPPRAPGSPGVPPGTPRTRPQAADPPIIIRADAGALVSFGTAPEPAFGAAVGVGLRRGALSLGISGRADLPVFADAPGGGRVSASLLQLSVLPCGHLGVAEGCLSGSLGMVRGVGEGVPNARAESTLFATLGVRAGAAIPIVRPLAVLLYGDFGAVLTPTALRLSGKEVFRTAPVAGALGASIRVHFQ